MCSAIRRVPTQFQLPARGRWKQNFRDERASANAHDSAVLCFNSSLCWPSQRIKGYNQELGHSRVLGYPSPPGTPSHDSVHTLEQALHSPSLNPLRGQHALVPKPLLPPLEKEGQVIDLVCGISPAQPCCMPGFRAASQVDGFDRGVGPDHFETGDSALPGDNVRRPQVVVWEHACKA